MFVPGVTGGFPGAASGVAAVVCDDMERVGPLEDGRVGIPEDLDTVDGIGAQAGVDVPRELAVGIGPVRCASWFSQRLIKVSWAVVLRRGRFRHTCEVGDGHQGCAGRAADQADGDGSGPLLVVVPGDEGCRAGGDVLARRRRRNCIEAWSLGYGGSMRSQNSGTNLLKL